MMEQFAENYISENAALRRKLQSKAEALIILSQELEQCRVERDQFKMMAEQVQDRYTKLKKMSPDMLNFDGESNSRVCLGGRTVSQVFEELKEQNKVLQLEVEDLKQKLRDAQGDMKALRAGMNQQRGGGDSGNIPAHQREELVQQLEGMAARCAQLQADMQLLLDEKEELVTQRDVYKCKIHRMNHQLGVLLHSNPSQLFDIDALVTENKYLHERLEQLKEENELSHQALLKYKFQFLNDIFCIIQSSIGQNYLDCRDSTVFTKFSQVMSMLDKKRSKGSVRLGTNSNGNSTGMVVSHKQVQQLLESGTPSQLPNTEATLSDLRSLCLALLEALQDKSLALSHQKKSNKILASRVYDLEQRLANVQNGTPLYPSQILLNGYSSSNVDKDLQSHDNDVEDSEFCNTSSCSLVAGADGSNKDNVNGYNETFVPTEESPTSVQLPSKEGVIQYRNLSPTILLTPTSDNNQSSITDGVSAESEELTVDVLPPQLQELVLNALKDIENSKKS